MMSRLPLLFTLLSACIVSVYTEDVPPPPSLKALESWPKSRRERFPSVEERVRLYMSNWYLPPCTKDGTIPYRMREMEVNLPSNMVLSRDIEPDKVFWMDEEVIMDCASFDAEEDSSVDYSIEFRHNMRMYCVDVVEVFDLVLHNNLETMPPIFAQFGDMKTSHEWGVVTIPHLKKFRSAAVSDASLKEATYANTTNCVDERVALNTFHSSEDPMKDNWMQPIVWKLATHRHYRHLPNVYRYDTPWEEKLNMAVWRGQLTGSVGIYNKTDAALKNCRKMLRCKLVYDYHKSEYIDAKLTNIKGRLPEVLNGVELVGPTVRIKELMRYKGVLMLEGNDVASGLKWALLSQSVVLMPLPKHTSWAMEELLEPWVHYVPLRQDISDIEEKMKWVIDNDEHARAIAERGSVWMEDLAFHPDATRDDRLIMEEILRRYASHFREVKRVRSSQVTAIKRG